MRYRHILPPPHVSPFPSIHSLLRWLGSVLVLLSLLIGTTGARAQTPSSLEEQLWYAARDGELAKVKSLIQQNVKVNLVPKSIIFKNPQGTTALHKAAEKGHANIIEVLLDANADIEKTAQGRAADRRTALHYAAENGRTEAVLSLLNNAASENARTKDTEETPLHLAAKNGHTTAVTLLLQFSANFSLENAAGQTPLQVAQAASHTATAQAIEDFIEDELLPNWWRAAETNDAVQITLLLGRGVDIDTQASGGRTALYIALRKDSTAVVTVLLKAGADMSLPVLELDGGAMLHGAVRITDRQHYITPLLEAGANVYLQDARGRTALAFAKTHTLQEAENRIQAYIDAMPQKWQDAAANNDIAQIKILLSNGMDIAAQDAQGNTALHIASQEGHKAVVEFLLANGADIAAQDAQGNTALHIASQEGHKAVVEFLLANGADVNRYNRDPTCCGNEPTTALQYAVREKHSDIVDLLLDNGADLEARDHYKRTALHYAVEHDASIVKTLVQRGANIRAKDAFDRTPLERAKKTKVAWPWIRQYAEELQKKFHEAVLGHRFEEAAGHVRNGAKLNTTFGESEGTALHAPMGSSSPDEGFITLLLDYGANPNVGDSYGNTPLHYAATATLILPLKNGNELSHSKSDSMIEAHLAAIKLLLKRGAKLNVKNNNGQPVLHYAISTEYGTDEARKAHANTIKFLLTQDELAINTQDKNGRTVLHRIAERGPVHFLDPLLQQKKLRLNIKDNDGNTALHLAAQAGNKTITARLLSKGASILMRNRHGSLPLHVAAERGHADVVALLRSKGAGTLVRNYYGNIPLHLAAKQGHADVVALLLSGDSGNRRNNDHNTPLHLAAKQGHADVVALLLDKESVQANLKNKAGKTPLDLAKGQAVSILQTRITTMPTKFRQAAQAGDAGRVQYFLRDGVDVHGTSQDGQTVLHFTAIGGHVPVWQLLMKHIKDPDGDLVNTQDTSGRTALHLAAQHGHTDLVPLIVKAKADITLQDNNGQTAVQVAMAGDHTQTVGALIKAGAKVDAQAPIIEVVWWQAVTDNDEDLLDRLILGGVDIHQQDKEGRTALHIAAREGHTEAINVLLKRGAKVWTKSDKGETALQVALANNRTEAAQLLKDRHNALTRDWWQAVTDNDVATLTQVANHGFDIERTNDQKQTALHMAAAAGHVDAVEALLKFGANVNPFSVSIETPLHEAIAGGHADVVAVLLANGADVRVANLKGRSAVEAALRTEDTDLLILILETLPNQGLDWTEGSTPLLQVAMQTRSFNDPVAVVTALLDHGFDVNQRLGHGQTPLHYAVNNQGVDVITLLLKRGAKVNAANDQGQTALQFAKALKYTEAVQLLEDHINDTHAPAWLRAAMFGNLSEIRRLLRNGLNVNTQDELGETALQFAAFNDNVAMATVLLEAGAAPNMQPGEWTALHYAADNGSEAFVRLLVNDFAGRAELRTVDGTVVALTDYLDTGNDIGETALHLAAAHDAAEIVTLLRAQGADTTLTDDAGKTARERASEAGAAYAMLALTSVGDSTALHRAAAVGDTARVRQLLEAGENVTALDHADQTPLEVAQAAGHTETAEALRTYIAQMPERLRQAAGEGNTAQVQRLLANGVDVNAQDTSGRTALHIAATRTRQETVALLLAHVDIDVNVLTGQGETALHYAADNEAPSIVDALLDAGAGLHIPGSEAAAGYTALYLAVDNDAQDIADRLLDLFDEQGEALTADQTTITKAEYLSARDGEGNTPLHIAASWDFLPTVSLLLDHGADVTALNDEGLTALEVAEARGATNVVDRLQAAEEAAE